jgi:glycosyltransferase involved in cell wall biosynthesis
MAEPRAGLSHHRAVNSDEIQRHPTPHQVAGRDGERPRGIVAHTNQGTAASTIAWFGAADSGVSAHYLVCLDGRVVQFVDEADTARHAGRVREPTSALAEGDPNRHTIGIEFEDGGDPERVTRTAAQYRAGAALIRVIAERWQIPLDREHVIGHRELFAAKACPGNLDLDRLLAQARAGEIVCLLAARNAAADLPAFLASAAHLCDAVVALDDGSDDATRELLEGSPLVERLLLNPRRTSWQGWDDGANRQRLLEAAGELDPGWVIFLDADERLDQADAAALRRLVMGDALRSCAYGLRHYRMWGDDRCDPRYDYVYRLFAYEPRLQLPAAPLHFTPVPESIPREAWVRTNIRLKHFGAASESRRAARLAKYREADPDGEYGTNFGRLAETPEAEELVAWPARPAGLGALELAEPGIDVPTPRLLCLLPARNCAEDLPGWFESVARFADGVIALDDGSTDETAELLAGEPLVVELLRNARRETAAGWDDAANRQRLLDAAHAQGANWVIQLDADERISADDAAALRGFVADGAEPGRAYGFRVYRMVGDEVYDRAGLWVYRLFACEPGQRLPRQRLHLVPVPDSIQRRNWRKTTFRIQHRAALTEDRRRRRVLKYRQADPDHEFQHDYSFLLDPPGPARPWLARPPEFPPLADPHGTGVELDLEELQPGGPLLSAIVISRDDEDRIEAAVRSVVEQQCPEPFEVVVVVSGSDRTAEIVRERFPEVTLVELEGIALPGRARNAGVAVARGEYVSFPGSHIELPPGSLAARLRAHELGHPMVTGSLLNGTDTPAGWAAYFLDHAGSLPGRASGPLSGPPAHCSYRRDLLLALGGFPEDMRAGEDTVVNRALHERGHRAYRSSEIRLVHRNRCETPSRLVRHHFQRGRAMGRILAADLAAGTLTRRGLLRPWLVRYVPARRARTAAAVEAFGDADLRARYAEVGRLVVAGSVAAWAGIWFELLGALPLRRASARRWRRQRWRRDPSPSPRP